MSTSENESQQSKALNTTPLSAAVKTMSFMDVVIQDCVNAKEACAVYLVNGIKLQGYPLGVDGSSLLFSRDLTGSAPFAVNKAAIASFVPTSAADKDDARQMGMRSAHGRQ